MDEHEAEQLEQALTAPFDENVLAAQEPQLVSSVGLHAMVY